jgi:HAD superfamily hydrolase (TIGR01509 family)
MNRPELIIFDVDGLMINSEFLWKEAHVIVGEKHHIPELAGDFFEKGMGLNNVEFQRHVDKDLKKYPNKDELMSEVREIGLKLIDEKLEPMPGLKELLDHIDKEGILKGVATATPRQATEYRLEKLGLLDRFPYIICGNELTKRKPDPECYLKVLDHFQIAAEKALVLEDSIYGVEAAYRAKIPCIMVPSIQMPQEKQHREAMMIADSLYDVLDYLKKRNEQIGERRE